MRLRICNDKRIVYPCLWGERRETYSTTLKRVLSTSTLGLSEIDVVQLRGTGGVNNIAMHMDKPTLDKYNLNYYDSLEMWKSANRDLFWQSQSSDGVVFDLPQFFDNLELCKQYGSTVMYSRALGSTQDFIYDNLAFLPDGTTFVTDLQTNGRGRGSNNWSSPPGSLLFSFVSSAENGKLLPLIQYIACLAVVKAIKSLEGFNDTDVRIKWPNDIYFGSNIKLGGILCQSMTQGKTFKVAIGVGINVSNDYPTTCLNKLGSASTSRETVLARIMQQYEHLHYELNDPKLGFTPRLQQEYEDNWLHSGQKVTLSSDADRKATIIGISPDKGGCLVAKDDSGNMFELHPNQNSFNFFEGLISRKLS